MPPLLEPGMPDFDECARACYRGFIHEQRDAGAAVQPSMLHRVDAALEALRKSGLFHHDIVLAPHKGQPMPTPTVVQRILVGNPGITYKYLGLRTFAHPWSGEGLPPARALLELNETLTARTAKLLAAGQGYGRAGPHEYNLTLVNLLLPEHARGGALRNKLGARLGGPQSEQEDMHAHQCSQLMTIHQTDSFIV